MNETDRRELDRLVRPLWRKDAWVGTGFAIAAMYVITWALDPPESGAVANFVERVLLIGLFVMPVVTVAAVGAGFFQRGNRFAELMRWLTLGVAAIWAWLVTAAVGFWSGDLTCGTGGRSCDTNNQVRLICLLAVVAIWFGGRELCLAMERRVAAARR